MWKPASPQRLPTNNTETERTGVLKRTVVGRRGKNIYAENPSSIGGIGGKKTKKKRLHLLKKRSQTNLTPQKRTTLPSQDYSLRRSER